MSQTTRTVAKRVSLFPERWAIGEESPSFYVTWGRRIIHCTPIVRKRLTPNAKWRDRSQEGQPLEGTAGATPRPVPPVSLQDRRHGPQRTTSGD